MNTRDRRRIYKRVAAMFLVAVVALTVVQRGSINMGASFQLERHTRTDKLERGDPRATVGEESGSDPTAKGFWKSDKKQPRHKVGPTELSRVLDRNTEDGPGPVTGFNCSANANLSSHDWFTSLGQNFKRFVLYQHCRHFPMLINHPEKCKGDAFLLMVIKSVATQYDRREAIRKTWGKEQVVDGKRIRTLFLLGRSANQEEKLHHQKLVEFENQIYGDILQWDFEDTFFNLTLKETHFLHWFHAYCPSVRYIFKGDDDIYVSIGNMLEFLALGDHGEDLFVGDVIFKAKPIRKKESKYYIPEALYNKTYYPPYAGGGGFIMDASVARRLHRVATTMELYPIDDVFLGMCLEVLEVVPVKHMAFKTFGLVKNKESKLNREPCFFKSMIVVHRLLPPDLMHMWNVVNSDLVCSQKVEIL